MGMSPLNDNSMYLQLAQAAAARGNPQASAASGSGAMPPASMPPAPSGASAPNPPEPIPPQVLHTFVMGLPKVIPQITPQQAGAVVDLLTQAFKQEDSLEGPEPSESAPPPMGAPQ